MVELAEEVGSVPASKEILASDSPISDSGPSATSTSSSPSACGDEEVQLSSAKKRRFDSAPVVDPVKEEIASYIRRARIAQESHLANASQDQVDLLIRAITYSVCREPVAQELAKFCVGETQLGNYEGKLTKLKAKTRAALFDILNDKSVGVIEEVPERNLTLIAKPVGVVGASTPATHPEATPVIKAINCIKGRNAIVISPNPRSRITNARIVERMREALHLCGFPEDLIIGVDNPSRRKTMELFAQADRVWATGGNSIVQYAYSSGTPAFGVGVGNAAIFVDASADLAFAAANIAKSKTFDLASSCSADNSVLAHETIYSDLEKELENHGAFFVNDSEQKKSLKNVLWKSNGALNADAVVRSAHEIGKMAGIEIPSDKSFIVVRENGVGPAFPFSGEKLSVVLALYKVSTVEEAIALTNEMHRFQGQGHSAGVYSKSDENILRFSSATQTSRIMVNQPQSLSNSGSLGNGMRQTLSLGCGSWGGSATSENIFWKHFVNITYVSRPLKTPKVLPSDEQLFCSVLDLFSPSS